VILSLIGFLLRKDVIFISSNFFTLGNSDIENFRLTWLAAQAINRSSAHQMKIIEECYGSHDEAKILKVKQVYNELDLPQLFKDYEEQSHDVVQKKIEKIRGVPKEVFQAMAKNIYRIH